MKKNKLTKKIKLTINNQKQYKVFKSNQLLGLIFILFFSFLAVISTVNITGFTTIFDYSFGFLFGYYSYFVFAGFIYYGLSLMFNLNIKIEKFLIKKYNRVFHFSWAVYSVFIIGISLVLESIIIIVKKNVFFPGINAFDITLSSWWTDFINTGNAALPGVYNSGVVIALLIPLIVSWTGYPVSIILGLFCILYFVFYFYFGSIINIFTNSNYKKTKLKGEELEKHETKILDLSFENENSIKSDIININLNKEEIQNNQTALVSIADIEYAFPIEDPFKEDNKNNEFIENKTKEFNIKNNLIDKDFSIDDFVEKDRNLLDSKTFDFELDIFNTTTEPIYSNDTVKSKKDK